MAILARPAPGLGKERGKLGGVCAAIGRRFGISPRYVRLGFVLSLFIPGPQILAYVFFWWFIPEED
ncbi:PspC domain-containing protein [Propionicicella superfundia]|uniref:PspC domain-containing protein n=1 Tax=Propionicicella superfundia TaxID=348582 RepID=UPI00042521B6|nr:PspC domain-containing protein [Propionicicella superfundia]